MNYGGGPTERVGFGELRLARSDYAGREWTFACGREGGLRLSVGGESVATIGTDKLRASVDSLLPARQTAEELLDALQTLAKQRRCPLPDEVAEPIFAVVLVRLEALAEIRDHRPLGGPSPLLPELDDGYDNADDSAYRAHRASGTDMPTAAADAFDASFARPRSASAQDAPSVGADHVGASPPSETEPTIPKSKTTRSGKPKSRPPKDA